MPYLQKFPHIQTVGGFGVGIFGWILTYLQRYAPSNENPLKWKKKIFTINSKYFEMVPTYTPHFNLNSELGIQKLWTPVDPSKIKIMTLGNIKPDVFMFRFTLTISLQKLQNFIGVSCGVRVHLKARKKSEEWSSCFIQFS